MTVGKRPVGRRYWIPLAVVALALVREGTGTTDGRRRSVEISACAPITLPLQRHAADVTVPVDVLGSEVQFVLDLGASDSYVLREGRARFHLPAARDLPSWAVDDINGWRTQTEFVAVASLRLGGVERGPLTMPVSDLGYPADAEARQSEMGLLGNDLLKGYDLDLDTPASRLTLYPTTAPCSPSPPAWTATATNVPLRFSDAGNPVVPISIDGRVIEAVFDTGDERTLIKDPSRGLDGGLHQLGFVGPAQAGTSFLRAVRLAIGDVVEEGFLLRVAEADGAVGGRSLLGIDFMRRRRFWLSRSTRQLYISMPPAR